ncbi:NodT family efflux transporter outer membrane factor (OMF) lipoprotein [Cupriavidus sp. H19C3]|uniref:efflux transporter outer membrane subunit n=1 Tax=Cupriavidus sp. H19C3 TaxID=3241603 RepID=UPI003BF8E9A9
MRRFFMAGWGLAACLCSGCGSWLQTPYERPTVALPDGWDAARQMAPASSASASDRSERVEGVARIQGVERSDTGRWWEVFGDAQLNSLLARALARNADLAMAAIRVRRAQLEAGLADTNLTPDATLRADGGVRKTLKDGAPSTRNYGLTLSLSYEIDLWGKLARTRDVAAWRAEATAFDRQGVMLSLVGTTAVLYWTIAELNARIADAHADIADARRLETMAAARHAAGAAADDEPAVARRTLASRRALLEQLLQQREAQRKALVVVLQDTLPEAVVARYVLPDGVVPAIAAGIPASVLAGRPDVAAAEARIRANLAAYDARRANFFPTLSLTGSVGGSSRDLGQVLSNPLGTLGGGLLLPVFNWNATRLAVGISRTEYEESVVSFGKTLYQAFAEVDEALAVCDSLAREETHVGAAMQQAAAVEAVSAVRYRAGKTNIRFWLDDQRALREARAAVARNRLGRLRAHMSLYQALGGGV